VVRQSIQDEQFVATAKIAYVETYSGLNRKRREGGLGPKEYAIAIKEFEAEYESCVRIETDDTVLFLARDLTQRHPLRALDAIHLAAATSLKSEIGQALVFATADRRLLGAAELEGLKGWYVEEEREETAVPDMVITNSATIRAAGYDPKASKLYVQFRKPAKTYVYVGVSETVFTGLMRSRSKAAYLNRYVSGRYPRRESED